MYIGIAVGDEIKLGLVNDDGETSFESTFPIEASQNIEKLMLDLIYTVKSISETVPLELFNERITGIGISIRDIFEEKNDYIQKTIQRYFDIPVIVNTLTNALESTGIDNQGIIAAGLLCKGKV